MVFQKYRCMFVLQSTNNMTQAEIILQQLGGRKFIAMTGSKNLMQDGASLRMNLVRNHSKAKYLSITLMGNDTYEMNFFTADKNFNIITVENKAGVYADMLQSIFTQVTGLYTSL